jgi:glycosyltransferase involved in cell wall biosynthesis
VIVVHLEDEAWDSGLAQYALDLAAEQKRRGHDARVWGRRDSPVLAGAAARGLPTRGWKNAWLELPALRRELAAMKPNVLDAHTGSAHALALALVPRRAVVVRTRGDARPPKGGFIARLVAARTAAFIAANSELKSQMERALPGARVRLVPQGAAGPEKASALASAPVVGMLARFDPVKGHETAIAAARLLARDVKGVALFCAGDGILRERLSRGLKPLGLEGLVEFPGRVVDKWAFIASCRVGIVPSLGSEAVSRAALEWMAAGRAVVASRVGGLPDLIEDGETGLLVPPGDPAALAAAVRSLLDDSARLEKYSAAARARWERLFSLRTFYETTQDVYEKAAAVPR